MTIDEFRQIMQRHGGLRDTPAAVDPQIEGTDRFGRPGKIPNPTPTYRYIFNDGTTLEAITQPNGDVQLTNPGTAENKAGVAATGAGGFEYRTYPDGSLHRVNPATGEDFTVATKPQGPQLNEPPTLHTLPDGSQAVWDPVKNDWDIKFPKAKPKTAPDLDLGAPRPGQKTDLKSVQIAYNLFAQQLANDPNVTPEQYTQRLQAYIAANVTPAIQRATDEVNAEADRVRKQQEEAATRATARETRLDTTADRSEARSYAEFQQRAGQDTVSNALKLLAYQHNPLFLEQFSAGLNTLAGGGGTVTFTPEAFRIPLPDTNALAEQGAQRAAALYAAAGGVPFTPRPMAGAVGQPTPLGGPPGPLGAASSAGTMLANSAMAAPPPRTPGLVAGPGVRDQWGLPVGPDDPFATGVPTNY